jgi:hypothetical protein
MSTSSGFRSIVLVVTLTVLLATNITWAQRGLTDVQQLQLEVNALTTLNSAISEAGRKVTLRDSYLSEYFRENSLQAEYRAYLAGRLELPAVPETEEMDSDDPADDVDALVDAAADAAVISSVAGDADAADAIEAAGEAIETGSEETPVVPETPTPRAGDWGSGQAEDPDREIPLTYEDAYQLALEYETETNLQAARETDRDRESLLRSRQSWDDIASENFPMLIEDIMEVERKVQFLHATGRWDAFMAWAEEEYERREEAAAIRAEDRARQQEERANAADQAREQLQAEREERERQRAEELEQRWQRRVEAYQLQTERIAAQTPETIYYPTGRWWR